MENNNYVEMPGSSGTGHGATSSNATSSQQHDDPLPPNTHYAQLNDAAAAAAAAAAYGFGTGQQPPPLTPAEIEQLRLLLNRPDVMNSYLGGSRSMDSADSDYAEFGESTHAWAVFADNPHKRAGPWERVVGVLIIVFQLFAYRLFAAEAIEDFQAGQVPLMISHRNCLEMEGEPYENFQCEAEYTNTLDAFVAFFMLGIFLAADMLQAARAIRDAPWGVPIVFACFAGVEVCCAFLAASIAVSFHLFIGEITDAVEVGVGLLFIRELSQQTYRGIRHGKTKQFRNFFLVLLLLVALGMLMDPLCAKVFAGYIQ
jgi:hypothetical protein